MSNPERGHVDAEPVAAERVDDGTCSYADCEHDADYRVEWEAAPDIRETALICEDCSRTKRVWVVENDLLDAEVRE